MSYDISMPSEPKPNMAIALGDAMGLCIQMTVQRTVINRFRYWMLCQFFPFKIVRWE